MNSQYFDEKDVKNGIMTDFINLLLRDAYNSNYFNDIHIRPTDCGDFIVEWIQVDWQHTEEYPCFTKIDVDQRVVSDDSSDED